MWQEMASKVYALEPFIYKNSFKSSLTVLLLAAYKNYSHTNTFYNLLLSYSSKLPSF